MDYELERRRALPLLRRLRREFARYGCNVAMLDSRPCLTVATHRPEAPLPILVNATGTHFTWTNNGHRHPVEDVSGAASAIVACIRATRNGQAMGTDESPRQRHLHVVIRPGPAQRLSIDDDQMVYRIPLPALPIAARQARQVLAWALRDWDLRRLPQAASLVLSELVANAAAQTSEPIMLTLTRQGDQVLIEVWDAGEGRPEAKTPGEDSENGRGLLLVSAYATKWDYRVEDTGKTVWALIGP